jgi:outer membrane murein-binding lipoprotein Lpp
MSMTTIVLGDTDTSGKVVVHLKGALEADDNLKAAMVDYSYVEWVVVTGDITSTDLAEAEMLIMIQADPAIQYTSAEISAVKSWFDEGNGKLLWVASDSDYPDGQELRPADANAVLEAVGSKLRGEHGEAQDPLVNFDASYRVRGVSTYCSEDYKFLVAGVTYAQFHGCGVIIGYVNGNYYALEETEIDGVHIIMTTSDSGIITDESAPAPEVHTPGQEGAFAMMVLEEMSNARYVIATSDAPFMHYSPMYKPEIQKESRYGLTTNHTQHGAVLFGNILDFAVREGLDEEIGYRDDMITDLETEVSGLASSVSDLEDDVSALETEKTTLEGEVSTLTSEKSALEADLTSAQSSASTMQLAAIAALVIGVVVGYFVGPMIKKQ